MDEDKPKHECGIALLRLLKPASYYQDKYGTEKVGVDLMYMLLEKQRNRGQDGAGVACVRLDTEPGESYMDVCKSNTKNAIDDLFEDVKAKRCDPPTSACSHKFWDSLCNNTVQLAVQGHPTGELITIGIQLVQHAVSHAVREGCWSR